MNLPASLVSKFKLTHLMGSPAQRLLLYNDIRCPPEFLVEACDSYAQDSSKEAKTIRLVLVKNMATPPEGLIRLKEHQNDHHQEVGFAKFLDKHPNSESFQKYLFNEKISPILTPLPYYLKDIYPQIIQGAIFTGTSLSTLLRDAYHNSLDSEDLKDYDFFFKEPKTIFNIVSYLIANTDFKIKQGKTRATTNPINQAFNPQVKILEDGLAITNLPDFEVAEGYFKKKDFRLEVQVILTNNALTLHFHNQELLPKLGSNCYQFIFCKTGGPAGLSKYFDFAHCKLFFDLAATTFIFNHLSLFASLKRRLLYEPNLNSLHALVRAFKFHERGWKLDAGQLTVLIMALQKVDFNDPQVLKTQFRGLYDNHGLDLATESLGITTLTPESLTLLLQNISLLSS